VSTDTCEVIDLALSATSCKNLPTHPGTENTAIGGLGFNGNPIICGGYNNGSFSNSCYSLENNEWVSSVTMNSERYAAAASMLQDGKLLVTGGKDGFYDISFLNSAELLSEEGWESNIPSLPITIYAHCMVTVNSTTVMAIGGWQNGYISGKTFYFTFWEESWTEGPELKNKRGHHSCGKIRRKKENQEMSIIVAGGLDGSSSLSSVEILNEGSNDWQTGPELPVEIEYSQMVEDLNGGVVLIGGESSSVGILDTLYQLPHGGQDAGWTEMELKLETGRSQHTSFLVPDNIVDCS
jgi:hypothetical protein